MNLVESEQNIGANDENSIVSRSLGKTASSNCCENLLDYNADSSSSANIATSIARQSIDDKYSIAIDESRFTAYQQVQTGKGTIAFFAITLKSVEISSDKIQSAHFQHGDVLSNHIFLTAVSHESPCCSDVYLVFVKKDWFFHLYDRLLLEEKSISAASQSMFERGTINTMLFY